MELFPRELYLEKIRGFYHDEEIIKVITGVRRCGKSSLMQTIAHELTAQGVAPEQIVYLDLDARQYRQVTTPDALEKLIEAHDTATNRRYLFIDEIQNVRDFEPVINGFRTDGGWSIFITGSNSYLLSGELVTKLTGRYIEFEMFPLSFEEYEKMKAFYGISIDPNPLAELNQYILSGGFPKALQYQELAEKQRYVQSIVSEIFEKDIRHRMKIRDRETFEIVRKYLIANFGATTNITNICNALHAQGVIITRETVARYVQILVNAKILYECPRFDIKSKKSLQNDKKYYLSDLGFFYADNTDNRINYGPVLENLVYIYAKSHDYQISVGRIGKLECDFIVRGKSMDYAYIQVAYTILQNKETEDREYRSLEMIRDNYPKYVLTADYLLQRRNGIIHANLLDFVKTGQSFC